MYPNLTIYKYDKYEKKLLVFIHTYHKKKQQKFD